jgi:hypothetical protein
MGEQTLVPTPMSIGTPSELLSLPLPSGLAPPLAKLVDYEHIGGPRGTISQKMRDVARLDAGGYVQISTVLVSHHERGTPDDIVRDEANSSSLPLHPANGRIRDAALTAWMDACNVDVTCQAAAVSAHQARLVVQWESHRHYAYAWAEIYEKSAEAELAAKSAEAELAAKTSLIARCIAEDAYNDARLLYLPDDALPPSDDVVHDDIPRVDAAGSSLPQTPLESLEITPPPPSTILPHYKIDDGEATSRPDADDFSAYSNTMAQDHKRKSFDASFHFSSPLDTILPPARWMIVKRHGDVNYVATGGTTALVPGGTVLYSHFYPNHQQ